MKCKTKMVRGAKAVGVLSALVLCVCFVSCNEDADEEGLFYDTYNADGTLGSSGLTQSDWESLLAAISNEGTIVLSSDLTSYIGGLGSVRGGTDCKRQDGCNA